MKLVQEFGVNPPREGGGVWLQCTAADLGNSQSMTVRTTISQEAMLRGMPLDRVVYDLRRKLEVAFGDALFNGVIP